MDFVLWMKLINIDAHLFFHVIMLIMKKLLSAFLFLVSPLFILAQDYPVDTDKIKGYFNDFREICDRDNGNLWGANLWAPILIIDKESRFIVANQPDNEGLLRKTGEVYTGYYPKDKGIANSTTDFGGRLWMMVMYPLPENEYSRNQLCIHELFHSLQKRMNISFGNPDNSHLDNMDARILLKLEWTALEKALTDDRGRKKEYLEDALVFRNYRRALYPGKTQAENELEILEGLADYTGHRLCSGSDGDFRNNILSSGKRIRNNQTYVRSFAYYSGPLYGFILDRTNQDWRAGITTSDDLGVRVQHSYNITIPEDLAKAYKKSRNLYNYDDIFRVESEREEKRQEVLTVYRNRFTRDTVLILDIPKPNVVFDPRTLIPLDTLGTVYPAIRIIADWGILQVNEGGCLFDWKKAIVSGKSIKQNDRIITGDGWEIELAGSWKLVPEGMNYRLKQENY
jgi:hypothetical protein